MEENKQVARSIDFRDLVKAGVHFGHETSRWCPKMAHFIWGHRNNVHLIDVSKTAVQLEKAAQFLEGVAAEGKSILWVGTKKPAQNSITEVAQNLGMPYVSHRWIGGTLSNFYQVKKSITKLMHLEDVVAKAEKTTTFYTKKELGVFNKMVERLKKNVGGIKGLTWPVGAIVLIDVRKEQAALKEAVAVGVPVVALVDTNGDPSLVDFVIPGNDDAPRAIKVILAYLEQAAQKGKAAAATKEVNRVEEVQVQKDVSMAEALLNLEDEEGSGSRSRTSRSRGPARRSPASGRAPAQKKSE